MNTDQNVPEWGKELIKGFADLTKLVVALSDKISTDDKSKESEDQPQEDEFGNPYKNADDQELPDLEFNVTI